jgi:hypothetical protein
MRRLLLAAAVALLPAAVDAQAPQYRRAPGDTLRYGEVTRAVSEITTPQGKMTLRSDHAARIAVAFAAGDTARAWYEALALRAAFPGGERVPQTAPLLGQPFVLTLGARGEVATLSVPAFPAEVAETTDLTHQFNDFFPKLPGVALRPGAAWTDTTRTETPNAAGRTLRTTRIGSYRVRGDTTVGGTRAVVIEARMRNRLESSGPSPTPGMTMNTLLEGTEAGTMVFAPGTGRMLRRARTGTLSGHVEFVGGPAPVRLPQVMTYESAIELLP